ncbi:protein ELC-like [Macadamia integrifolia]|uniref:protein ELC-like n=1 Tax=Macadamia integrifolia TaxID=60698 RepID=UPI001C4E68D5|nr:protein ELC-like [Macadamia integrifolia]
METPIHTASKTQNSQQFLSNVLSERGPSALPYAEEVKWVICQHLIALIDTFPPLQPKTAAFTHNDGRTVNLLQAEGTVPMVYQDIMYYIPVVIWLMESYPRDAPCIYVTPTRGMIIKRPHSHVDPSGLVSHPYLHNWIYPSSNLVDLVCNLSYVFGNDPPVYSSPQAQGANPPPNRSPNSFSSSRSSSVHPPYGGSRFFPPAPSPQQQHMEDQGEIYRRNLINQLMEKLHVDAEGLRKNREAGMEGLFDLQVILRQRDELLSMELRKFQEEKEGLEQELQMIMIDTDMLESWLRENGRRGGKAKSVEVEEVFELCDGLSRQMLECTAADLAIEDVIYTLDESVQEGSVPFDQYMRNIRSLSREQFFHRATATKARELQMQSQVANMATRISQYIGEVVV